MTATAQHSSLYVGEVSHRRRQPRRHDFSVKLFMLYLDLDEIDEVFRGRWFWSAKRIAPARFRRRDYLGPTNVPLKTAVLDEVERQTGQRPSGPVRMLTHLRYFGYCFNPVTIYFCRDETDRHTVAICAQITNTPWKERHCYVLADETGCQDQRFIFAKTFHVSPFMEMNQNYEWLFRASQDHLLVHMENRTDSELVFDAMLRMQRRPITGWNLARCLLRYPFMTAKVSLAIYYQALRLKLKRVPFHTHPAKVVGS